MAKYRLKPNAGIHFEDGREYRAGDIVESKVNLAEIFPHKFERLIGEPLDTVPSESEKLSKPELKENAMETLPEPIATETNDEPESVEETTEVDVQDVTKRFSLAIELGVQVKKTSDGYNIVEPDGTILASGLKYKDVRAWLKKQTEEWEG